MTLKGHSKTKCPFFKNETAKKIYCVGYDSADIAMCFKTPEDKRAYQENFCFTYCFHGCRVAQIGAEESGEV